MVVPPKHPKMMIFGRKTHGCWVPPFLETPMWLKTPQDKADLETDLNDDTTEKKVLQKKSWDFLISFFELFFRDCGGDDNSTLPTLI